MIAARPGPTAGSPLTLLGRRCQAYAAACRTGRMKASRGLLLRGKGEADPGENQHGCWAGSLVEQLAK